uniref:small monomeric GTPase n=1 Tax=Lygus hesperus TaxID=30085 RepID=A0A0A9Z8I2_LYGHE
MIHEPTRHPQCEELVIGNVRFKTHDLGGHQAARRLWKQYYAGVDGVVFLVDTVNSERFHEVREELEALLAEEALANVPFLILGNKIDAPGACSELQLKQVLNIENMCTGKDAKVLPQGIRPMEVYMCSVIKKGGYTDGFRWLANYLN